MPNEVNVETITAIATSIIATCALVLTVVQLVQTRRHNRLNVKPHLDTFSTVRLNKGLVLIELINNGLGPAEIVDSTVEVDGTPVDGPKDQQVYAALRIVLEGYPYNPEADYLAKGYFLAAKDRQCLVRIQFTDANKLPTDDELNKAIERCVLKITYQSIYGDKAVMKSDET
jgi:hypothetical protein